MNQNILTVKPSHDWLKFTDVVRTDIILGEKCQMNPVTITIKVKIYIKCVCFKAVTYDIIEVINI